MAGDLQHDVWLGKLGCPRVVTANFCHFLTINPVEILLAPAGRAQTPFTLFEITETEFSRVQRAKDHSACEKNILGLVRPALVKLDQLKFVADNVL
jgi:hypothetical protein